jgi:hypothetical protein
LINSSKTLPIVQGCFCLTVTSHSGKHGVWSYIWHCETAKTLLFNAQNSNWIKLSRCNVKYL